MKKIGILGTGDVGQAIGKGFISQGYEVMLGSREETNPKAETWAKSMGPRACAGTFQNAARFGDLIVLATLGIATENAITLAGIENFNGKTVWDTTNPLDFSKGMPPRLLGGLGDSAGEKNQRILPKANIVKVFNTVGNALMYQPKLPGGPPDMFICGNNSGAKQVTTEICQKWGWNTIDLGGIEFSHYLEAMCLVWVISALKTNQWSQAFKLLKA